MQIMNEDARRVIGGVDAHADTHHAAVLDERGTLLESKSFPVSASGYRELLAWLRSFGEIERVERLLPTSVEADFVLCHRASHATGDYAKADQRDE